MGVQIVRVPPGFAHPVDEDGGPIPGAHLELLYYLDASQKTAYQVCENVTEGTPNSPIFDSLTELKAWLVSEGWPAEQVAFLLEHGHAPSFVARL